MNIPDFDITEFTRCSNCSTEFSSNRNVYHSRQCLHKICENCFRSLVLPGMVMYKCKSCNEAAPLASSKDFSTKPQDEILYEKEYKMRREILGQFMYKHIDSFNSEKEYDDYLEKIEDLIEKYYDKGLNENFSGNQTKEELNMNLVKREGILNILNKKKKERDPNNIYNSKIDFSQENNDNLMELEEEEEPVINQDLQNINFSKLRSPIYHKNANIVIIRNQEKKIKTGGYDVDKVYGYYSNYAKGGLFKLVLL